MFDLPNSSILVSTIGGYPRIGEGKDQQRHRRALAHLQNKDISPHAFLDVEQSVTQEIIQEQINAGVDELTDGLSAWQDPISHFCRKTPGIKIGGLARYFDTNFYYRIPIFTSRPKLSGSSVLKEFIFAKSVSYKPIRVVLTGPYTLARHSLADNKLYDKFHVRFHFFRDLILKEISQLIRNGAQIIQIDEPSLGLHAEDFSLFQKNYQVLFEATSNIKLILAFYFSPLSHILNRLLSLPAFGLNLDFTYDGKELLKKILNFSPKGTIGFGLVDSKSTVMEEWEPLVRTLRLVLEKVNPSVCYLTPSAGLDYLPREKALAKINLLTSVRTHLLSSLTNEK